MGKKPEKEVVTNKERLESFKKQQEEFKVMIIKLQGAIEILEQIEGENEKTD